MISNRKNKIFLSIALIILGWCLNAFAWSAKIKPTINTICLIVGLGLFIIGLILLIQSFATKNSLKLEVRKKQNLISNF